MQTMKLGEVTISRVIEIDRSSFPTASMLPGSSPEVIAGHHRWLKPHFFDERTGDLASRIQTYVVKTQHHTILIDTGVGNDKARTLAPAWNMRTGGTYLDDLAAVGVTPEQVDFVVCTHLHVDHVGWNTRWKDGRWVPTFPNAKYVIAGAEWEFWKYESDSGKEESGCIADSVVPVVEAGQALLVDSDFKIGEHLRFEPWVGHTPGHVCVRLTTSAGSAVFSGDLMHRTVQVAEPQWSSRFCYDPAQARDTRRAFVERHADSGTLVLAGHFPHPGYIVKEAGGYRFTLPG
ncbi:MAG TPA: MBL fold metallo-hydrolase [Methylomirabilota bacterium]|jgi:glyoxylase-like metal-dependent hydrolase (beta-lactamase superfamily II)|nr:MBL fold metallo-hydrolase [Methylomirabilota bacterium]